MVKRKFGSFFLLILIVFEAANALPGLDFLSTGFDALKMINLNEEPSASDKLRFRIFDLSDDHGDTFSFNADGTEHTYKTSSYVQVTQINMKTKVALESLSKTFQNFRHDYFQSYSFGIDVPIPLGDEAVLDISFAYHHTLREGYETISKNEGSVGISSDWWGIYSIILAPTYLVKFDPMFKAALDKLVAEPKTPKDQSYYNRLVQAFGTHYVSSVIVGGLASLYTHITHSFNSQSSQSAVEEGIEISLKLIVGGNMTVVGANGMYAWGSQTSSLSEEFKQNSLMQTKFIPAIIITPGNEKNQWQMWKQETLLNPSVVNRTLSPLVDLLIDYPDTVQSHLQATIDYYLRYGVLPTLNQLQDHNIARNLLIPVSLNNLKQIPGLDAVGCGFDIGTIENRHCLFDLSPDANQSSTWTDVYNSDKTYRIPPNFFVSDKRNVNSTSEIKFFRTIQEYFQMSIYSMQDDKDGFLGFGASSHRKDITEKYKQFYEYNHQMAWTRREISMYTLTLNTFSTPNFNDMTKLAIDRLPDNFDSSSVSNINRWKSFFNAYGTHVVTSSDMGGLLLGEDYFGKCLITKYSEKWIREQIQKRYWFFENNHYNGGYKMIIDKIYQQYSSTTSKMIGGNDNFPDQVSPIDPYYINTWISIIKNYPQPINYRLMPIYKLLPKGDKRESMKMATHYFRMLSVDDMNAFIERLKTHSSPPPLPELDCYLLGPLDIASRR